MPLTVGAKLGRNHAEACRLAQIKKGGFDWNDEAIAKLRELWTSNLTRTEIGRALGVSKGAIIGKAQRLGLPPRGSVVSTRRTTYKMPAPRPVVVRSPPKQKAAPRPIVAEPAPQKKSPETQKTGIHAIELKPDQCNYPLWGLREKPTFMYCGDPVARNGYCARHAAKCFEIKPRKDKQ